MNVDKAYILGLVIGGGIFGNNDNAFHIKLPYKQWGSIEKKSSSRWKNRTRHHKSSCSYA